MLKYTSITNNCYFTLNLTKENSEIEEQDKIMSDVDLQYKNIIASTWGIDEYSELLDSLGWENPLSNSQNR